MVGCTELSSAYEPHSWTGRPHDDTCCWPFRCVWGGSRPRPCLCTTRCASLGTRAAWRRGRVHSTSSSPSIRPSVIRQVYSVSHHMNTPYVPAMQCQPNKSLLDLYTMDVFMFYHTLLSYRSSWSLLSHRSQQTIMESIT